MTGFYIFPSENCTTAYFPVLDHELACSSAALPFCILSVSSSPSGKPTTTSALHVLSAKIRRSLLLFPSGPSAVCHSVVYGHANYKDGSIVHSVIIFICTKSVRTSKRLMEEKAWGRGGWYGGRSGGMGETGVGSQHTSQVNFL